LGLRCLKVGLLPAKGDPQEQEAYQKKKLEPRLAEARAGERAVFFVDAAHFVFGAFLGYLWCFVRCWIKAPSGRQRFSVLGALNAVTHDVITVTTLTYINAQSVCQLLVKLAELSLQVPITLVLDNARYQRCALVQSVAIEPFDDLRTQTSTDNTDLLSKSRVDVHMSRHGSITPSVSSCSTYRLI